MQKKKIPVVIPVYKPDPVVFDRVKEMLRRQTIPNYIIEIHGMTEAKGMNHGILNAQGEVVVTMNQDCIPVSEDWLEKLIAPFKDPHIVAASSDTAVVPQGVWEKSDVVAKALTLKERSFIRPALDARGSAYRKKVFKEVGGFSEEGIIGIDDDLYHKIKNKGKIAYPGCKILHWHFMTWKDRMYMEKKYAEGGGIIARLHGWKYHDTWKRIIKATPLLGILPVLYVYPYTEKNALTYFPLYFLLSPALNFYYCWGFFKGYFEGGKKK